MQKFLSGGAAPPRIVGFWLPAAIADRVGKLLEYPINEYFDKVPWEILRSVFGSPPDILFVHLEKDPTEMNTKISEALEGSISRPPRILALTDKGGGTILKHPPKWADDIIPLDLPDPILRLNLKNALDFFLVQKDLEIIFLAHRVGREQLLNVTFTDPLTGLLNRAGFQDMAARELSRMVRTQQSMSLIIIDIDRFKNINDTYGHPTGDSVLRELAQILRAGTRDVDSVIRFGGEEFGIILPHTEIEELVNVSERLRENVEAKHFAEIPKAGDITISLGAVCIRSSRRPDLEEVYPIADNLLYQAKEQGRNRVVWKIYE